MNILFMGTPDFAVGSLTALINSQYSVIGVVTQPDKPAGRGHKVTFSAVKEYALQHNLKVYQPETLKNKAFLEQLQELNPDMIVVTAYGKILPEYVLKYPKYGCINVHASLLPHLRGAAPIQWSVINGDTKTGITTMLMDAGLDTGDMLLKEEVEIAANDTSGEVYDHLYTISGPLLIRTIQAILEGTIKPQKQPTQGWTYAPMLDKNNTRIDWTKDAKTIYNLVRGLSPYPLANTTYEGKRVKIIATTYEAENKDEIVVKNEDIDKMMPKELEQGENCKSAGQIGEYAKDKGLAVYCGSGILYIKELQMEGKKRMKIDDFLRGNSLNPTILFE